MFTYDFNTISHNAVIKYYPLVNLVEIKANPQNHSNVKILKWNLVMVKYMTLE